MSTSAPPSLPASAALSTAESCVTPPTAASMVAVGAGQAPAAASPWSHEIPSLARLEGAPVIATVYQPSATEPDASVLYGCSERDYSGMLEISWDCEVAAFLVERNRLLTDALYAAREYHEARDCYLSSELSPPNAGVAVRAARDRYDAAMAALPGDLG